MADGVSKAKLNISGVHYYLNCPEVQADLKERAERIAAACNADAGDDCYRAEQDKHRRIAAAHVWTKGAKGARDNDENRTLIRNLDKGR